MSDTKMIPGNGPSRRLSFAEFMANKLSSIEESFKKCRLEHEDMARDLKHLEDNILKYEGFIKYTKQLVNEWTAYSRDTAKIRESEDAARKAIQEEADTKKKRK